MGLYTVFECNSCNSRHKVDPSQKEDFRYCTLKLSKTNINQMYVEGVSTYSFCEKCSDKIIPKIRKILKHEDIN